MSFGRLTLMLFSSFTFHFSLICLPSGVRADTSRRFDFLPCWMVRVLSGVRVISFWKVFLFLGSSFCSLASSFLAFFPAAEPPDALSFPAAEPADALFFPAAEPPDALFFLAVFLAGAFLNRSFTFFRKGEWL